MNKRDFLAAAALGSAAVPALAQGKSPGTGRTPALLTVTGAIGKTNRGPFDPVVDQMMAKQKIAFDKACTFDFATLAALPSVTIRPTLEYDNKPHTLRGPLLADVLKAAQVSPNATKLAMRAVDGYSPAISIADAPQVPFHRRALPGRKADGAGRTGASVGHLRGRSLPRHGGQAGRPTLRAVPLGALSHRRAGLARCARVTIAHEKDIPAQHRRQEPRPGPGRREARDPQVHQARARARRARRRGLLGFRLQVRRCRRTPPR